MVTLERAKDGIASYIEKEIISKIQGARKWMVALSVPSLLVYLDEMIAKNMNLLVKAGYMTEDSMVDVDRLYSELRTIASKTGTVTEHFPLIGDVMFSIDDIDSLRSCILNS